MMSNVPQRTNAQHVVPGQFTKHFIQPAPRNQQIEIVSILFEICLYFCQGSASQFISRWRENGCLKIRLFQRLPREQAWRIATN